MPILQYNQQLLQQFEQGLDPKHPQNSKIPVRVLGYGEISTTLEIGAGNETRLAYKRVPMFHTEQELDRYEALYRQYIQLMSERVGIRVIASDITRVLDERRHKIVGYIVQEKLPLNSICNNLIHHLSPEDVARLVRLIMIETAKVFDFNQQNRGRLELAIDGQVSNWAIANIDPNTPGLPESIELTYFDTSSPFISIDGIEQADPELFLRSAPSFLVWILRLLFLQDVMTRYYDPRKVLIDLIANFYKEQRPELVPGLVAVSNEYLSHEAVGLDIPVITTKEVKDYYREDEIIWSLYLSFRQFDRFVRRKVLRREYPYILPGKIRR
jgi:hypothetical protein